MTIKEKVLTCYHCGNKTVMREVASYLYKDIDEIWDHNQDPFSPLLEIEFITEWKLYFCRVCINVTLEELTSSSEEFGEKEIILYPFKKLESNYIPKQVAGAYEAALKVRQIDGAICAIAIRRTLEMMCKDMGEEGKGLYQMLKSLSEKGILPPIVNEMATVLRELGNAAAHADEADFNHELVPSMIEFTNIILDYVYNLPNEISRIQNSISGKTPSNVT